MIVRLNGTPMVIEAYQHNPDVVNIADLFQQHDVISTQLGVSVLPNMPGMSDLALVAGIGLVAALVSVVLKRLGYGDLVAWLDIIAYISGGALALGVVMEGIEAVRRLFHV